MLTKWDPFGDLRSIEDEVGRLMGRSVGRNAWVPALDVRETDERFELMLDLPGIDPSQVQVSFEDGNLTVTGSRESSKEESGETWHRVERGFGTFARSIRLPRTADPDRIEASYDKGVLTVRVAKAEVARPRQIEVKSS